MSITTEEAPAVEAKPAELTADVPPKVDKRGRPTTRAGRRAAGEGGRTKRDRAPRGTARAAGAPKRPTLDATRAALVETLAVPALLLSAKCKPCGVHVAGSAETLADAWVEVARVDDRVRRVLETLTTSSALMTAVTVTLGVALPVLANHTPLPVPAALGEGVPHDGTYVAPPFTAEDAIERAA